MDSPRLKTIFSEALVRQEGPERAAYLDEACRGDAGLRAQVETLLKDHERIGRFLGTAMGPVCSSVETAGRGPDDPQAGEITQAEAPHTCAAAPAGPGAEGPGAIIGPYKLLQQLGEGGMGTVFMAEQAQPVRRKVALKVIKPGMDSRQVIARFEAERQALAMMDHVNIARVFDAGATSSGRPYFVMELVHGVPITKYCDDNHLTPRQRLELFVPVCQAIQHAHQKGVIHRDIKPSNVMITLYDGKPVPKVIDFGVAKATEQRLTERTLFTQYGTLVGTLEYMSPEQAEMSALGVDTRSDIFSLGVLLYELLTGGTPLSHKRFQEAAYGEVLRMIKEEEAPTPSIRLSESGEALASISAQRHMEPAKLVKLMRGELDWIVMKCLEKDRNRRYETANGFAADVQRYLNDETVDACPPSAWYRCRKFARRNKRALASAVVLGVALLMAAGAVAGSLGWVARDRAARQAAVEQEVNLAEKETARWQEQGKWTEALSAAKRAEGLLAGGEPSERLRQLRKDLEMVLRLEEIRAQGSAVREYKDILARADQEYAATFRKFGIDLDALPAREAAERITARRGVAGALVAAVGDWAFVRGEGDQAAGQRLMAVAQAADPDPWRQQVRDALARKDWASLARFARSEEMLKQPPATLYLLGLALRDSGNDDGIQVMRQAQDKYPSDYWINHRLGQWLVWMGPAHAEEGIGYLRAAVAIRPRWESYLQLGHGFMYASRWEEAVVAYRKVIELTGGSPGRYARIWRALLEAGKLDEAVTSSRGLGDDGRNNLAWLLANCPESRLRNATLAVELAQEAVDLSPKTRAYWNTLGAAHYRAGDWKAAIGALETSMQLDKGGNGIDWFFLAMAHWQLGNKEEAHKRYHQAAQWMAKNQPANREIRLFRTESQELLGIQDHRRFQGHSAVVRSVAFFPDGCRALSAGYDKTIRLWDVDSGKELACLRGHAGAITSAALSFDGRRALSGATDRSMRLWDLAARKELLRFEHHDWVESVAFSPDGRRALSGSVDAVHLWDLESGQELAKFEGHAGAVRGVAFSPDGRRALSGGHDKTVRLWDVATRQEIRRFAGHTDLVLSVALSPDGRRAISGGCDKTMRLWDVDTGKQRGCFVGHQANVESVAFSPDGRRALSGGADGTIRLWDLEDGRELHLIGTQGVMGVAISWDGRQVLSAHEDNGVRLWTLPDLEMATPRSGREPKP